MTGPAVTFVIRHAPGRRVRWGSLRRTRPFSAMYGWDRGLPVDRYYIEGFLERQSGAIRGEVMEIETAAYTRRFGGSLVTAHHVVDVDATNRDATLIADLCEAGSLPRDAYDTVILTQTLHVVDDDEAALRNVWDALRPDGVLLLTAPCLGRIDRKLAEHDNWRYTPSGMSRRLARLFPQARATVEGHGNVLAAVAFLHGISTHELTPEELDLRDPMFPLVVCVRLDKPGAASAEV